MDDKKPDSKPVETIKAARPAELPSAEPAPWEAEALPETLPEHAKYRHAVLTDAEIDKAKAAAAAKLQKERVAAAMKAIEQDELQRLREEMGLVVGGVADEMVSITIDNAQAQELHPCLMINGRAYWHGHTYTVPRHVADTLRDMMYRTWVHERDIDGKGWLQFYQKKRQTVISPKRGTRNAPQSAG